MLGNLQFKCVSKTKYLVTNLTSDYTLWIYLIKMHSQSYKNPTFWRISFSHKHLTSLLVAWCVTWMIIKKIPLLNQNMNNNQADTFITHSRQGNKNRHSRIKNYLNTWIMLNHKLWHQLYYLWSCLIKNMHQKLG